MTCQRARLSAGQVRVLNLLEAKLMGFPLHHSALLQSGLDVCAWGPISHCYPRQDRNRDLVGRLCVQVRMEELAILTWVPGNLNLRPGFGKIHSEIPGR